MICMRCQQEGKHSSVMEGGSMTTLIHYAKRYDENGNDIAAKTGVKTLYSTIAQTDINGQKQSN